MRSVGELARLLGGRPGQMSTSGDVVILTAAEAEEVARDLRESAQTSASLAAAREADRQAAWIASRREPDGVGSVAQSDPGDAANVPGSGPEERTLMDDAKPSAPVRSWKIGWDSNISGADAWLGFVFAGEEIADGTRFDVVARGDYLAVSAERDEAIARRDTAMESAAIAFAEIAAAEERAMAAEAERDRLREALKFYAEPGTISGFIARFALGVSDER